MASAYTAPDVYIEDVSGSLPPSVVPVATAIPVFIGYAGTEEPTEGDGVPIKVASMVEFESKLGRGGSVSASVTTTQNADDSISVAFAGDQEDPKHILPYAIRLYFSNGGGRCHVISLGRLTDEFDIDLVEAALTTLEAYDEPTLVLCPDAAWNSSQSAASFAELALAHCKKMGDRFALLDVVGETFDEALTFRGNLGGTEEQRMFGAAYFPFLETRIPLELDPIQVNGNPPELGSAEFSAAVSFLRAESTAHVPPSAAIAGVCASVDRNRGVWKAPANVELQRVTRPSVSVTQDQHGQLNVHPEGGRSVNVIRKFVGRGTLVWGARTLLGNSNEFRYVNVRRYFNFVEESAKKATAHFMFEPNDKNTWVKVKSMISAFLTKQWREGALAGATPDDAFYVHVGLGETMSSDDVLNGLLIVEIGLAVVRPAEFIVLRFSHKLQVS